MSPGSLVGTWEREHQSELKSVPVVSGNQKSRTINICQEEIDRQVLVPGYAQGSEEKSAIIERMAE
jgi:hypothetical protein